MTKNHANIYLVGPRASGKTTLGRMIAESLQRPFVDMDQAFADKLGQSIADFVAARGWEAFRDRETAILGEIAARTGAVVATGGGAALKPENRELMRRGLVLYLQSTPERLAARLAADANAAQRPSLTGADITLEVAQILAEREPIYLEIADVVLPDRDIGEMLAAALKAVAMLGQGG